MQWCYHTFRLNRALEIQDGGWKNVIIRTSVYIYSIHTVYVYMTATIFQRLDHVFDVRKQRNKRWYCPVSGCVVNQRWRLFNQSSRICISAGLFSNYNWYKIINGFKCYVFAIKLFNNTTRQFTERPIWLFKIYSIVSCELEILIEHYNAIAVMTTSW